MNILINFFLNYLFFDKIYQYDIISSWVKIYEILFRNIETYKKYCNIKEK